MVSLVDKYLPNSPKVIHENIQGELVVINLDTGFYYSIMESGPQIWLALIQGYTLQEIISHLKKMDGANNNQVASDIKHFVSTLLDEELIISDIRKESGDTEPKNRKSLSTLFNGLKYVPPAFEKYTDMEEMLLLDPIHDVEEAGWPNPIEKKS